MIIYQVIFIISAMLIMYFDFKKNEFSSLAVMVNYFSLCMMTQPWLLLGFSVIVLCYMYKQPIDWLYVFVLCYLLLITTVTIYTICAVVAMVVVLGTAEDDEKISFMAPLELALATIVVR